MRQEISLLRQERARPATVARPSQLGHTAMPPPLPPRVPTREGSLERLRRARGTVNRIQESTDQSPTGGTSPQGEAHPEKIRRTGQERGNSPFTYTQNYSNSSRSPPPTEPPPPVPQSPREEVWDQGYSQPQDSCHSRPISSTAHTASSPPTQALSSGLAPMPKFSRTNPFLPDPPTSTTSPQCHKESPHSPGSHRPRAASLPYNPGDGSPLQRHLHQPSKTLTYRLVPISQRKGFSHTVNTKMWHREVSPPDNMRSSIPDNRPFFSHTPRQGPHQSPPRDNRSYQGRVSPPTEERPEPQQTSTSEMGRTSQAAAPPQDQRTSRSHPMQVKWAATNKILRSPTLQYATPTRSTGARSKLKSALKTQEHSAPPPQQSTTAHQPQAREALRQQENRHPTWGRQQATTSLIASDKEQTVLSPQRMDPSNTRRSPSPHVGPAMDDTMRYRESVSLNTTSSVNSQLTEHQSPTSLEASSSPSRPHEILSEELHHQLNRMTIGEEARRRARTPPAEQENYFEYLPALPRQGHQRAEQWPPERTTTKSKVTKQERSQSPTSAPPGTTTRAHQKSARSSKNPGKWHA